MLLHQGLKATVLLSLVLVPIDSFAARKALVIGNADYTTGALQNPVNDASDMHKLLKQKLNFSRVDFATNTNRRGLKKAIKSFINHLEYDDLAFVYYAGHGLRGGNGRNYLIPVDAEIESSDDIESEGYSLNSLIKRLNRRGGGVNIVVLDACRNNPWASDFASTERAWASSSRGLARTRTIDGTIIAFATQPEETAADNCGRNGCFTEALLRHIATPGQSFVNTMRKVRSDVSDRTDKKQIPSIEGLTEEEVFLAGNKVPAEVQLVPETLSKTAIKPELGLAVGKLTVEVQPSDATVRIMNIGPKYEAGMELLLNKHYDVRVSRAGYVSWQQSIRLDKPKQYVRVTLDKAQWIEPEMVTVPSGSFSMGDLSVKGREGELPVHNVNLQSFLIGKYEVTFDEYDAFVKSVGANSPDDQGWGRGRRPVINVSWDDAKTYIKWLNLQTGKRYRLLTESEWEYAARADTKTLYSWGNQIGDNRANCWDCRNESNTHQTVLVGSFTANAFELFDMHGNVQEWVEDRWHNSYSGAPADGREWVNGGEGRSRVLRGGSWIISPEWVRSANRNWNKAGLRTHDVGFRLAHDF